MYEFFLLILLLVVIAFALLLHINPIALQEQFRIFGGRNEEIDEIDEKNVEKNAENEENKRNKDFREVCVEKIDGTIKDIDYIDNMYGEKQSFSVKGNLLRDFKSNEQIQSVVKFGNINEYARLITLIGKHINARSFEKINIIKNLLYKKNDLQVYSELCKYFRRDEEQRSIKQAQDALRPLKRYLNVTDTSKFKYLDLGCGNGKITAEAKKILGLSEVHCVEVDKTLSNPGVKYHYLDVQSESSQEYKLPYENNSFDLITAYMSLHHVENLESMIKEINRILKPDGILFIKEHDTWNAIDAMLVDIEHAIFIYCNELSDPDKAEKFKKYHYFCHYKNYWGWDKILGEYFEYKKSDYYYSSVRNEISPTRAFWAIYQKK